MPLHLLGKKSWNVYNQDNIERVRRDEAEAHLREEAAEKKSSKVDADRRLAQLRGLDIEEFEERQELLDPTISRSDKNDYKKKRKLAGEDDTDRDIRLARQESANIRQVPNRKPDPVNLSLFDQDGHIDLITRPNQKVQTKNAEAEAEAATKKRTYEDQYTMRFSNAAGVKAGSDRPWYNLSKGQNTSVDQIPKDVWGKEDPGRKEREIQRLSTSDPLAAMKKGVKQLRQAEAHRKEWRDQREKDLYEVEKLARREQKHKRRRQSDEDSLEDFDLDGGYKRSTVEKHRPEERHRHRHYRSHSHRHRHKDRERSRSPRDK